MTPARHRRGLRAAAAIALATGALLVFAARAEAVEHYNVAQCGWRVGEDASWLNSTGNDDHFIRDQTCVPSLGAGPWDNVKISVRTRRSELTTSAGAVARWRWTAPPGAGIVAVRGNWWRAIHGGFLQRLSVVQDDGTVDHFASSRQTSTSSEAFRGPVWGESWRAFENRLVCPAAQDQRCAQNQVSYAAVNALVITLEDPNSPQVTAGGDVLSGGWERGARALDFTAGDRGGGVRTSQTEVDGTIVATTQHGCSQREIGGEPLGTRMRPCAASVGGSHIIDTSIFSDGAHSIRECAVDFAGTRGCGQPATARFDNSAPAGPLGLAVDGGDGWRSANDFDLTWTLPDQGQGSSISGAGYRVVSADGRYDSGPRFAARPEIARLDGITVPGGGTYRVSVWLRDEAGNEDPGTASSGLLRLDTAAPRVAFANEQDPARPEWLRAAVSDDLSGLSEGRISYRPQGSTTWTELPTELGDSGGQGAGELVARFPSDDAEPGTYEFRAEVADVAGNQAMTVDRADGSQMFLRNPVKIETAISARIRTVDRRCVRRAGRRHCREYVSRVTRATVAYGGTARLVGRLSTAGGTPLPRRDVVISSSPDSGASTGAVESHTITDLEGRYSVVLPAGPSRTVEVSFDGSDTLTQSAAEPVRLLTAARASLTITPLRVLNRERILLRGSVAHRGAAIPSSGKLVAIQFYDTQRRRWRPVQLLHTDAAGRYEYHYRFLYITQPARISFRAAVVPESGWPYSFGASPKIRVTVYPE